MSVPVNARKEGKMEVFLRCRDLCKYTLEITANEKHFPPKYQEVLTKRICEYAISIHTCAWKANNIRVSDEYTYKERHGLQAMSIASCYELLSLMDIAKPLFHLETRRVMFWTGLILETRKLLRAWRDADVKRYGSLVKFGM